MTVTGRVADWSSELGAIAVRQFAEFWDDVDELTLAVHGPHAELAFGRGNEKELLGRLSVGEEDAARRMREILSTCGIKRRDIVFLLPSDDVLRPTVRLPRASRHTLRRALGYEIERLSPVPPNQLYFDFAAAGREPAANTVEVELRIIRRELIDPAIAMCRAAGVSVGAIRFEGEARPADWRAFPVGRAAALRSEARRLGPVLLAGAAVVLLIAVLLAAYLRGAAIADDLVDQVSTEGLRAAQVERLRQRIDRTATQFAFLERQRRTPLFVAILNDVTRTLPDGTWISEFDLHGNRIRIDGYSREASNLIAIFDRSGRFTNAQFAAPVTQGMSGGLERFDLTFELAGGRP
jgi:general secretion pathway protein L